MNMGLQKKRYSWCYILTMDCFPVLKQFVPCKYRPSIKQLTTVSSCRCSCNYFVKSKPFQGKYVKMKYSSLHKNPKITFFLLKMLYSEDSRNIHRIVVSDLLAINCFLNEKLFRSKWLGLKWRCRSFRAPDVPMALFLLSLSGALTCLCGILNLWGVRFENCTYVGICNS